MGKQLTVADYIVQRLAREGITDCFGVAGDFAFKLDDAVVRSKAIRWIGCSNELDAAYAADGYARVRGCSLLSTTYAVGELSALNGVMGAKAERSCVFHLVGMPTMRKQRVRQIVHHTLGDGEFQNFANISAQAACVSAVITPDNCATRNGAADRHGAGGEPARLHPRRLRLCCHPGHGHRSDRLSKTRKRPRPGQGRCSDHRADSIRPIRGHPPRIHRLAVQAPGQAPGVDRDTGLPVWRDADGKGRPLGDAPPIRWHLCRRRFVLPPPRSNRRCRPGHRRWRRQF